MRQGSRDIRAKERESQQVAGRLPITVAHAITILGMATFLHTMVRITDPEKSRAFYEALGFRFTRDLDIVRDGELEATNYFFSIGESENVLELTYNHDGRTYELGTGYGHIAIGVDDLDATLGELAGQGIEPERPPYSVKEGGSRLCFVRDPDGYPIELIGRS
jgi:lactoylglutathione lyase